MVSRIGSFTLCALALSAFSASTLAQSNLTAKANSPQPVPTAAAEETDRVRDGLVGPVRRVRTEVAKLSDEKTQEGKHVVLEVVSYDLKGSKVENQYFPIAGANLTGKEVYKYDDKGNISEMTLLNTDGSLLSAGRTGESSERIVPRGRTRFSARSQPGWAAGRKSMPTLWPCFQ